MKIILQKTVDKLGNPGDIAEVADGYARNYLIPRGLAIKAEKGAVSHAESLKRAHVEPAVQAEGRVRGARVQADRRRAAGDPGARRRGGQAVRLGHRGRHRRGDRGAGRAHRRPHDVQLDEPIRSVGTHEVKVKLFHEVEPVVTVEVVAAE